MTKNLQVTADNPERGLTPADLIKVALQSNADIERLQQLMEMKERYEANEARKAFAQAMAEFKSEPISIPKEVKVSYRNSKGTLTEYMHSSLGSIVKTVSPLLSNHGFSFSWRTETLERGRVRVTCRLTHELGHFEEETLEGSPDQSGGKNDIQALGSVLSYLKRYTVLAVTGVATEEFEDDGAGGATEAEPEAAAQPSEDFARIADIIAEARSLDDFKAASKAMVEAKDRLSKAEQTALSARYKKARAANAEAPK